MKLLPTAMASVFAFVLPAYADCKDGLRPDIVTATLDTSTALSFLWFASEEEFNERKSKGNGLLGIPNVLEIEFANDASTASRRSKLQQLGYTLDESRSLNYFASTLPAGVREEFFKCEQAEGLASKPFYLSWSQSGVTQDGNVRTIKLELKRVIVEGQAPEEFSLKWVSSDADLQQRLNQLFKKIKTATTSLPTSFEIGVDDGVSIEVYRVDKDKNILTGVSVFVPPTPKIAAPIVSVWKTAVYSIPIFVVTHRAHIGDRASTINYNPDITNESDSGNLVPDFLVVSNNQEITLRFDYKARSTLPTLTDDDLNFEYRCAYTGPGPWQLLKASYPADGGWLAAGAKCGMQKGSRLGEEPIMTHLAFRLIGRLRDQFVAKLSCRIGNDWIAVVPESGCTSPSGLTEIRMEIDSIGPN